jgi:phage terminase large subunit-like protein
MDVLNRYVDDVMTGKLITGDLVKLAVKRFVKDLKKQETTKFPYYFDEKDAEAYLRLFQMCRHWKGDKAGQRIVLEPHQVFLLRKCVWMEAR